MSSGDGAICQNKLLAFVTVFLSYIKVYSSALRQLKLPGMAYELLYSSLVDERSVSR